MGRVRWTEQAAHWLQEIHDYIARDNREAARRTVRGIYELAQSLDHFPERGSVHRTRSGREVRVVFFGHYRIVYLIRANAGVEVLGIFHGALDLDRYLE